MNFRKFLSELERRKVYRVSIAYGIAASFLGQIASLILESFEAEPWVMQMIIAILILGFPVALVLSWIFDIGPEGIERTASIDDDVSTENEPISVKLVIGMLIFIILIVVGTRWSINAFNKTKTGPINSLAILPFDNFTGADSLEYFVAGMQSSLIGDMQRISALRVPSKTSSNSFKDDAFSIPEIATQLNVDAAVEGSITCMGEDSICVQIRLIRVFPEEQQLWVQDYNIDKGEILDFYNKVTRQISEEINIALKPMEEEFLALSRKVDPKAYDAYLKGLYYWEKLDVESAQKALEYFQLASELDPEWADPYAGLANAWGIFGFFDYMPKSVTLPKVYPYLNKALELNPNSAKAHFVAAILAVWTEWDWEKGEREFLRSIELDPNDALTRMYYAHLLMILRRVDEANQQADKGLELDPMKPLVLGLYGVVLLCNSNKEAEAIQIFEKTLSIEPNDWFSSINLNEVLMIKAYEDKEYEKWLKLWNEKVTTSGSWTKEGREAVLKAFDEKGHLAAIEEMFKMNSLYPDACYMSGGIKAERYIMLGNIDKAAECFEKDYENRDNFLPYISTRYPYFEVFKGHKIYVETLKKMNLPSS